MSGDFAGTMRAATFHREAEPAMPVPEPLEEEGAPPILATQARYADFVVVSQAVPGSSASGRGGDLAEGVVVVSGSPTIVVPYAGTLDKAVERVVIAWNGSPAKAAGPCVTPCRSSGARRFATIASEAASPDRQGMLDASPWRKPPGGVMPVAASYLHAGTTFGNLARV